MNKTSARQKEYNCRACRDKNRDKQRNCFWFNGEEQDIVAVQQVDDEYETILFKKNQKLQNVDVEKLMGYLIEITDAYPQLSPLGALRLIFPSVCPKSLFSEDIDLVLSMESFCREYGLRPLGDEVGYLDYPIIFVETFGTIGSARERVMLQDLKETK